MHGAFFDQVSSELSSIGMYFRTAAPASAAVTLLFAGDPKPIVPSAVAINDNRKIAARFIGPPQAEIVDDGVDFHRRMGVDQCATPELFLNSS
jgi:hypothetical protein